MTKEKKKDIFLSKKVLSLKFSFPSLLRQIIIFSFGFAFFSIPTFSFLPRLNVLTWLITICLSLGILFYLLFYKGFKIDFISASFILFTISSTLSSLLNGFEGFKITAPILSVLSFFIYLFCKSEKQLRNRMLSAAFVGTVFFLISYCLKYSRNLFIDIEFDRLGAEFGDINDIALFLAFGGVFSIYQLLFNKNFKRFFLIPVLLLFVYCGFSTGSKIFLIELAILCSFMIFFVFGKKKWWFALLIIVGLVALGLMLISFVPVFSVIKERTLDFISTLFGTNINGADNGELSTIRRLEMFIIGFELFLKKPLFGWGIWGFASHSALDVGWSHNNFSESLCNFGLVGTILFHFGFIFSFYKILKTKKYQSKDYFLPIFILIFFLIAMFSVALNSQKIYSFLIPVVFVFFSFEEKSFYISPLRKEKKE